MVNIQRKDQSCISLDIIDRRTKLLLVSRLRQYGPYNTLVPNSKGSNIQYSISFHNARIKDGCICYNVKSGSCKSGMKYFSKE